MPCGHIEVDMQAFGLAYDGNRSLLSKTSSTDVEADSVDVSVPWYHAERRVRKQNRGPETSEISPALPSETLESVFKIDSHGQNGNRHHPHGYLYRLSTRRQASRKRVEKRARCGRN